MAGRPAKTAAILSLTNDVSHRTKREIALRAAAEKGTLTGEGMKERGDVKNNMDAHKEFMRLRRLFRKIEKDDAIYAQPINDYCLLHAECLAIAGKIERIEKDLDYLEDRACEMDPVDYLQLRSALYDKELKLSAELDKKRDKKRAIEDKNLMNIQSALRSIPKKPDERKNPLKEALSG